MPRFFLYKINKKYIIFSLTPRNRKILLMNFYASGRVKELYFWKVIATVLVGLMSGMG